MFVKTHVVCRPGQIGGRKLTGRVETHFPPPRQELLAFPISLPAFSAYLRQNTPRNVSRILN